MRVAWDCPPSLTGVLSPREGPPTVLGLQKAPDPALSGLLSCECEVARGDGISTMKDMKGRRGR